MDDPIRRKGQRIAVRVNQAGNTELLIEVVGIALGGGHLECRRVLDDLATDRDQVYKAGYGAIDLERGIADRGQSRTAGAAVGYNLLVHDVAARYWRRLLALWARHRLELVLFAVREGDGHILGMSRLHAVLRDKIIRHRLVPEL